jgi:8-oxo-dGTP pyrophosphatase MutT (NUDIX family)
MNKLLVIFLGIFSFLSISTVAVAMNVSAGILPFCVHEGKGYFLIGQAIKNKFWSDFGGNPDKTDPDIYYTAAREFSEETRYVYGIGSLQTSINYILPRLKDHKYLRYTAHEKNGKYIMYIVEVDYIPAETFNNAPKVPHAEKRTYCWIPAQKFLNHCADQNSTDTFEGRALRKCFWYNLTDHRSKMPEIISSLNTNNSKKNPVGFFITAPQLAMVTVLALTCYWAYAKYKAYVDQKEQNEEEQQEQKSTELQCVCS